MKFDLTNILLLCAAFITGAAVTIVVATIAAAVLH
jgi:hypothetical protein